MNIKKISTLLFLLLISPSSWALKIVVTNDDSWSTQNVMVLKQELVRAGHSVILSTPCTQQSGKSGAMVLMKDMPVDDSRKDDHEYCVGDSDESIPYKDFVQGTPVVAALYGIEKLAAEYWGETPDLLISGPNEGNNLGVLTNNSGTLGAAMIALSKGVSAIALSADTKSKHDPTQAPIIAAKVIEIIRELESTRKKTQPLLPKFTGLNINFPSTLSADTGCKFTKVGRNSLYEIFYSSNFIEDSLFVEKTITELVASSGIKDKEAARKLVLDRFDGQQGISIRRGDSGDKDPDSEGNVLSRGVITISAISASKEADESMMKVIGQRLDGLK